MTSALNKLSSIDDVEAGDVTSARPFRLQASCDDAFCKAAASRFGFVSVSSLSFAVTIKLISKECWEVSGTINADIAQQCGVTDAILQRSLPVISLSALCHSLKIMKKSTSLI